MSEIERKVLSLMMNPKETSRIWDMGLRAEAFEDLTNKGAFDWMIEYWQNNSMLLSPTWVVMEHEFPALKLPNKVEEATEWLVGALQQRLVVNRVQSAMVEASGTLDADPEATAARLWQNVYDITESTAPRASRSDMSNVEERDARYVARGQQQGMGMPIGLPEIDLHTHGIRPGELAAVAAFTKVGKSFLLCKSIAEAHLQAFNPIIFTLEMSVQEMEDRIDAFYSGVSYSQLVEGSMMPVHERQLREARERLRDRGPLRIERPQRGERTVKAMTNRARQVGADYVLIDQLSFMDPAPNRSYGGDNSGMRMKHGDIIFDLKDEIARESAGMLPCFLAVQQNRASQGSGDGRGQLHNLANSSFIEQTCDIVYGLWRNDDMRNSNMMGVDIMGSRRSDKKSWILNWRLSDRTETSVLREYEE
jgi:replicative DNA helicase